MLPNSYRPISLLPTLSKALEKILGYQMRSYLTNRQFEFRSGTSTDQIILQIIDNVRKKTQANNESKLVAVAAVNIKKKHSTALITNFYYKN